MRTALVGLAFLLSGAAALVYRVVWQRILALHRALIVAAFMGPASASAATSGAS
ncbi:MAG TPA: hypothetical protein VN461_03550 [Vicinamibacteria bacterium]|nr:hypothetical protein [Vicinamibacteria bacterium]